MEESDFSFQPVDDDGDDIDTANDCDYTTHHEKNKCKKKRKDVGVNCMYVLYFII